MSYRTACDWCGATLLSKEHAEFDVTIHRIRRTELEAEWAKEARPSLHFCVTPAPDPEARNRMGLPDENEDAVDDCYTQAVAAITARPEIGLEWRLMPSRGDGAETDPAPATPNLSGSLVGLSMEEHRAAYDARVAIAKSSGGLLQLRLPDRIEYPLLRDGILTIADVERALSDGSIFDVHGIGRSRANELRAILAEYRGGVTA